AILPLDQFGSTMTLAVCEMPTPELIEEIVQRTNLTPFLFVAVRRAVLNAVEEEKKRGPRRTMLDMKAGKKAGGATMIGSSPNAASQAPASKSGGDDLPLPELELPQVSMKLMSGIGKVPVAPLRTSA